MVRDILCHAGLVQLPGRVLPTGFRREAPLRLILPDPAVQRIPPDVKNVTRQLSLAPLQHIGHGSLSQIKTIGVAHTPKPTTMYVLVKS